MTWEIRLLFDLAALWWQYVAMKDENQPATKKDLIEQGGVLRSEMTSMKDELTQVFDTKLFNVKEELETKIETLGSELRSEMSSMKDQILRAIEMQSENIFGQCAHRDEVAENRNRIERIETELRIQEN